MLCVYVCVYVCACGWVLGLWVEMKRQIANQTEMTDNIGTVTRAQAVESVQFPALSLSCYALLGKSSS